MTNITIDTKLKEVAPNLVLGVVQATVKVEKHSEPLWKEIEASLQRISQNYQLQSLVEAPEIDAVRGVYKALGKKPAKYRGSAEALLRRVLQGKGLYQVNNIVDINNLVSMETVHPVGSYNLDKLQEPIVFGIGKPGESYKGIGKDQVNIADLPVFTDSLGAYGSPTSDSERAMITNDTHSILMVIISFTGKDGLEASVQKAASYLKEFAQGEIVDTAIVE